MINFIGSEAQTAHIDKQTTTQQKTGYEGDNDILKNIYDLEGNNVEWTAQANDAYDRVGRGGFYGIASSGNFIAASCRNLSDPNCTNGIYYTARISLYLQRCNAGSDKAK